MSEEELDDAKLGAHSVDTNPVEPLKDDNSDDEFDARFQIETEAVFKRLARDIYESDAAGIREPLTNAITAILRAAEYDQIREDEGVVEITVQDSGGGVQLTMRDNGVGMTMDRIREIVAVIGASEARDIGDMAGQFGMGFLAVFRLVGIDGGFEMHTNPRYSEEGPISGIWKSGGFTRDTKGLMSKEFGENEYGTKFNFIVKDEISRADIRDWVSTYSEWARVPVVYEELVDGRTEFEENYGGFDKSLKTHYDSNKPVVEYEDEFVYAVSSTESDNRTILLDVPCERKNGSISTILGGVDIRLKNENGVVVEGPHKGDMVVSDGEYEGMDEERKDKYASEKNLTGQDVVLPQPTGTRRVLEQNDSFWDWIDSKLQSQLRENVESVIDNVQDYEDLMNLPESDFRLLCNAAKENISRRYSSGFTPDKDGSSVKTWFNRNTSKTVDDRIAKQLAALVYTIRFAPEGSGNISSKRNLSRRRPAMAVYRAYHNNGDIFMGCRLSEDKANIIWEDNDDNYVFRVESTKHYDMYEELLGWNKMTEINKDDLEDFDVSEETKADFLNVDEKELSDSNESKEYRVKLHFSGSSKYTKDITVSDLEEKLEEADGGEVSFNHKTADNIILFPSHKDRKISDNYWASDKRNPLGRCRKKDWERLNKYDQVETLDQRIENARSVDIETSRGEFTIEEFENRFDTESTQLMFQVLEEPYRTRFLSDEIIENAEEFMNENYGTDKMSFVYAPVTKSEYRSMKPAVINHSVLLGSFMRDISILSKRTRRGNSKRKYSIRNDTRLYAYVRLKEWSDTSEYKSFYRNITRTSLGNGGYELVETLYEGFKSEPFSTSTKSIEGQSD